MNTVSNNGSPATELGEWLCASKSVFDVLIGNAAQFPNDTVFVDRTLLEKEFARAFPQRLGAFPLANSGRALRKVALKFTRRLANAETKRLDISANGLTNAWFHPIYAEIMTIVPVRHLARKLHRENKGGIFAVELGKTDFTAVNAWRANELEPIYLAFELRRLGARVCIRMDDLDEPVFHFGLSDAWLRKWHWQFRRDRKFSTVQCGMHMRREEFASRRSGASRWLRPRLTTVLKSRKIGRTGLTLRLRERPKINELRAYSAPVETPGILAAFVELMSPATTFLRDWVRNELRGKHVKAAHISDHASLEGGLLAAEVVRQGGKVHLWPHSANVVHMGVHEPDDVAKVTLAARSTALVWAEKFGANKVSVDVRTILPNTSRAPAFNNFHPIHIVLFAGAHALQRVPFFGIEAHTASWKSVLAGVQSSGIKLTIKHKSKWETRDWIGQLSDDASHFQFTRKHATKLRLPNMVFMSISLTSTAIFEGIARGIPGIVVRDVPVNETPYYDPEFVPCLSSETVVDYLTSLNNREAWEALRDRQLDWFDKEISW